MLIPDINDYPREIRPLAEEDGGGFLINFPDLPGCISVSYGAHIEEAIEEGRDDFRRWMLAHIEDGKPTPVPNGKGESGRFGHPRQARCES